MKKEHNIFLSTNRFDYVIGIILSLLSFPKLLFLYNEGKKFRKIDDGKAPITILPEKLRQDYNGFALKRNIR
jgi:hypothetical protein